MQSISKLFWNRREHRIRSFWRLLIQLFALLVALVLLGIASQVFAMVVGVTDNQMFMSILGMTQNILVVGLVALTCRWPDRRTFRSLGLNITKRWWVNLALGFLLGSALMTTIFLIEWSMGWIAVKVSNSSIEETLVRQAYWIFAMVSVGFGEEVLSRGQHLKNLCEGFRFLGISWSFALATLLSSLFFALLHLANPASSWTSTIAIVSAGIMFCVGRMTTGSLAAPIGLHIAWNYFQGGVFGFPVSGNELGGSLLRTTQFGDATVTGGSFGPEAGVLGIFAVFIATVVFLVWPSSSWHNRKGKPLTSLIELVKPPRSTPVQRIT